MNSFPWVDLHLLCSLGNWYVLRKQSGTLLALRSHQACRLTSIHLYLVLPPGIGFSFGCRSEDSCHLGWITSITVPCSLLIWRSPGLGIIQSTSASPPGSSIITSLVLEMHNHIIFKPVPVNLLEIQTASQLLTWYVKRYFSCWKWTSRGLRCLNSFQGGLLKRKQTARSCIIACCLEGGNVMCIFLPQGLCWGQDPVGVFNRSVGYCQYVELTNKRGWYPSVCLDSEAFPKDSVPNWQKSHMEIFRRMYGKI